MEYVKNLQNRTLKDLKPQEKWKMLEMYLKNEESCQEIDRIFECKLGTCTRLQDILFRKMRNLKETKYLMEKKVRPEILSIVKRKDLDPKYVNESFLSMLSESDDMLTDHEILYAEYFLETGSDIKAIALSRLDIGLDNKDKASYNEACKIRSFYLKRKPNISNYLAEMRKRSLMVLEEGKEYLQQNFIEIVEQLKASGSNKTLNQRLKALEFLAKSIGAFEEKITVQTVNGDDVLDQIIAKAKEATIENVN